MATKDFTWYLHDNSEFSEMVWELTHDGPFTKEEAFLVAENRPFYEVTLKCRADLETGEVTILGAAT